jgi:CheY-like chemotaxis protein
MSKEMPKLLFLDDDEALRESLVDYFEDCGWSVFEAGTAEEAFKLLESEELDCVVVDIRLPGMDGNAFIKSASASYADLKFVICTGAPEYCLPQELMDLPQVSNRVFIKPILDLSILEEAVREQFEKCKPQGEGNA